jgi:hypothetical protein
LNTEEVDSASVLALSLGQKHILNLLDSRNPNVRKVLDYSSKCWVLDSLSLLLDLSRALNRLICCLLSDPELWLLLAALSLPLGRLLLDMDYLLEIELLKDLLSLVDALRWRLLRALMGQLDVDVVVEITLHVDRYHFSIHDVRRFDAHSLGGPLVDYHASWL